MPAEGELELKYHQKPATMSITTAELLLSDAARDIHINAAVLAAPWMPFHPVASMTHIVLRGATYAFRVLRWKPAISDASAVAGHFSSKQPPASLSPQQQSSSNRGGNIQPGTVHVQPSLAFDEAHRTSSFGATSLTSTSALLIAMG